MTKINIKNKFYLYFMCSLLMGFLTTSCAPNLKMVKEDSELARNLPKNYPVIVNTMPLSPSEEKDELNTVASTATFKKVDINNWRNFFADSQLTQLIDIALKNNQELNIMAQEIDISNNEIMARQGEYLPKVGIGASSGLEKVGKLTSQGVSDATDEYEPGQPVPEKLHSYSLGLNMTWELDIWKKLRNATKSAAYQYLASIDGRNFIVTTLIAEIASTYFELMAFDKQLDIVKNYIELQKQALELVKLQKQAARVTSLAVSRFEAEYLKNRSRQYEIIQSIVQSENRLNYLVGRLPQHINRDSQSFINLMPINVNAGMPSQILQNRPDIKQAERKLLASKLDVKVARARFYPSLSIEAGAGYESFNSKHLFDSPDSVFYNIAGNITAPLLNRKAIKADYFTANAKQIQAVYNYEKTVLYAYSEIVNQLSMIDNMQKTYHLKSKQVAALNNAVEVSNILFKAARADYVEVLMTRRDALEAQIDLVEIKKQQLTSFVNLYKSLGGGWQEDQNSTKK
jgi:outer membrane protein, multidrug efflux system